MMTTRNFIWIPMVMRTWLTQNSTFGVSGSPAPMKMIIQTNAES
jgi:hypothetical protein